MESQSFYATNVWLYSKVPGKDFARNRKLSFETMIKTLLWIEGGSLTNELMKRFGCHADTVSSSAFVQQRNKILPEAFETIFKMFAENSNTGPLYKGYRLFAVDGSDIQIPTNPQDADSYYPGTNGQVHLFNTSELKKLYAMRWGIETSFRELKYTVGLLHFHAKKTEHILQEIFARLTMYNFSELITSHVVIQKHMLFQYA